MWQQDLYLVPVLPDDPALQLDLETDDDDPALEKTDELTVKVNKTPSMTSDATVDDNVALLKKK